MSNYRRRPQAGQWQERPPVGGASQHDPQPGSSSTGRQIASPRTTGTVIGGGGVLAPRFSDSSHLSLITSFSRLAVDNPSRPLRPGFGTYGRAIQLHANFFPIKVPKGLLYDYTVQIDPCIQGGGELRIRSRIFYLLERRAEFSVHLAYVAHDRSQRIVSAQRLPQPLVVNVPFYEENEDATRDEETPGGVRPRKVYRVTITFSQEIDTNRLHRYLQGDLEMRDLNTQGNSLLDLISALNLILQQHANRTGIRVGREVSDDEKKKKGDSIHKYLFPSASGRNKPIQIEPGLEVVQGFFTSVRPVFKELMVNVNVCMMVLVQPGNLADNLNVFWQRSRGAMPSALHNWMIGKVRVRTRHLRHRRTIKAVGAQSARRTTFLCEDPELGVNGMISVEMYFQKKYNIKLKHPTDLPVIDVAGPNTSREHWVPAELCDIEPGQRCTPIQQAKMIQHACKPPSENAKAIQEEGFSCLGYKPPASPLDGFGITIDPNMSLIPARELRPPRIAYSKKLVNVMEGSWNLRGDVKFHKAVKVQSWWFVVVQREGRVIPADERVPDLVQNFRRKCEEYGMVMPSAGPTLLPVICLNRATGRDPSRQRDLDHRTIKNAFDTQLAKLGNKKPDFILVLLEDPDNFAYPVIKHIGDVQLGIHTIHMLRDSVKNSFRKNKQDQFFGNIALKVNAKLGGINHLLEDSSIAWLRKELTMLVGIDVTHPSPGSKDGTPSIAAVVANVDNYFVQFPASLRIQKSKEEMLEELKKMLVERLKLYQKKNKKLPTRIIVYRDGVSEGQYDTVLNDELPQIQNAFSRFYARERNFKYRPRLSIIICGKRHHARFFAADSANADRNGNTRPGTVVDKGVTGIFDFDFYLQAHAGIKGTVKATHYTVIYDENKLSADEVQQGTYNTSHLYARATKAVSLIPPAYYADIACERGRCYLSHFFMASGRRQTQRKMSKEERAAEEQRVFREAQAVWREGVHGDLSESMFYI